MNKLNIQKNGKPCIYTIENKTNGKLYVGSAIGHYRRKAQHFYMLRRNTHWNKHLQSAYNKYREEAIIFQPVEFIDDTSMLEERESFWITKLNSADRKFGYNIRLDCSTNLGKKWPDEARKRFSESKKGVKIPHLDYKENAKKTMKKVIGQNKTTMKVVYFDSIKDAGIKLKIDRTSISKALHGICKSAGNYYWNFAAKSA